MLKVKVDSGAQGNELLLRIYKNMFPGQMDEDGLPTEPLPSEDYPPHASYICSSYIVKYTQVLTESLFQQLRVNVTFSCYTQNGLKELGNSRANTHIFQQRMDFILEKCPGTVGIADGMAVHGFTGEEHDVNLHNVILVAPQHGLVFNLDKCMIKD
ncbi:uncharacterized protein [Montipora capricornis]|uniref:uncharacterized protein n=1 Tax=Montipora capricornis TaxID=246305 RepID=UPI0035F115FB